jgi:ferritin-like metal-binding protein YciE
MLERLNTPEQLYNFKLGAALKMEHTVLEMLDDNAQAAQSSELEPLFRHHQDETRRADRQPREGVRGAGLGGRRLPVSGDRGHREGGQGQRQKADDAVIDGVLLSGAAETERHEIAVTRA